jgi:hypothetical protein
MATNKQKARSRVKPAPKVDPAYEPSRTPLGAELRRIRRRIIESGEPLLTAAQIRREVAERRGGAHRPEDE